MKRLETKKQRFGILLAGLLSAVLFGLPAMALAEPVSLKTCMEQSVKNWNMLKASEQDVKVKEAERDSLRGNFLPKLMIDSNLMIWDQRRDAFDLSGLGPTLDDLGLVLNDLAPKMNLLLSNDKSRQAFAKLMGMANALPGMLASDSFKDGFVTHKKVTWTNTLTVAQPLVQLYKIGAGYKAYDEQAKSARYKKVEETHKLELDVARAYYGLIQALKASNTVETAIKQVEAIERQVQAYLDQQLVDATQRSDEGASAKSRFTENLVRRPEGRTAGPRHAEHADGTRPRHGAGAGGRGRYADGRRHPLVQRPRQAEKQGPLRAAPTFFPCVTLTAPPIGPATPPSAISCPT